MDDDSGRDGDHGGDNDRQAVERHYAGANLAENILAAIHAAGVQPGRDDVDAAPPVDHLHIRGRAASEELVALAAARADEDALDVGSGLGGPSRLLATRSGCRVLGVDLTHEYCRAARLLSQAFGLEDVARFVQGSATRLPVPGGAFGLVWTQHAQMNVRDKRAFYAELVRALAPGGRLVFHDIFAGPEGDPSYPLPWAETPATSMLAPADQVAGILEGLGLRRVDWWDRTEESAAWARQVTESGPAPGPSLIMGASAPTKLTSLLHGLEGGRLQVIVARWQKAP